MKVRAILLASAFASAGVAGAAISVEDAARMFPSVGRNADYEVAYPDAVSRRPQLRGVMLPPGRVTEEHFEALQAWGATLCRYQMMPVGPEADAVVRDRDRFAAWLDRKLETLAGSVLPMAGRHGLSVIVDLHVPPGGRDKDMRLCHDEAWLDFFVDCWRKIATRLKGRPGIYGYDLINEPDQKGVASVADYWEVQRRAAEAVRAIDPDTTILVASNGWNKPSAFAYLAPLRMDNVIYQVHVYQPMEFTHQGVLPKYMSCTNSYPDAAKGWNRDWIRKLLEPVRAFELKHKAKILVGEFSAVSWAEGSARYLEDCIAVFDEYGWDWTYHCFREWPGWDVEKACTKGARTSHPEFGPAVEDSRLRALKAGLGRSSAP